jgi:hypothetical protein
MNRFAPALLFFVLVGAHVVVCAAETGQPEQQDSSSKLQRYIRCDGFADGVRATILDRHPRTVEPWREVNLSGKRERVSVVDGYRLMYTYPRTFPFARLKAERSDPSRYAADKRIVTLNLIETEKADGNLRLVNFSERGYTGQTLTKKEMAGTTLGITQIFADEDSVIVTIFFLNQLPENRKFQTYEEFLALRDGFVRGYLECVAKKLAALTLSR